MMKKSGVTLVEVLAASAIFGLVIIGVMGIFTVSVQTSKKINYEYTATILSKNRIERLRNVNFGLLSTAAETDTRVNSSGTADPDGEYLRTTTVTTSYGGSANLVKVQVDVYYEYQGEKNQVPATMELLYTDIQ